MTAGCRQGARALTQTRATTARSRPGRCPRSARRRLLPWGPARLRPVQLASLPPARWDLLLQVQEAGPAAWGAAAPLLPLPVELLPLAQAAQRPACQRLAEVAPRLAPGLPWLVQLQGARRRQRAPLLQAASSPWQGLRPLPEVEPEAACLAAYGGPAEQLAPRLQAEGARAGPLQLMVLGLRQGSSPPQQPLPQLQPLPLGAAALSPGLPAPPLVVRLLRGVAAPPLAPLSQTPQPWAAQQLLLPQLRAPG